MAKNRNKDDKNVGVPGFLGAVLKIRLRDMQIQRWPVQPKCLLIKRFRFPNASLGLGPDP